MSRSVSFEGGGEGVGGGFGEVEGGEIVEKGVGDGVGNGGGGEGGGNGVSGDDDEGEGAIGEPPPPGWGVRVR